MMAAAPVPRVGVRALLASVCIAGILLAACGPRVEYRVRPGFATKQDVPDEIVLEDGTMKGGPRDWATRAIAMYDKWEADSIVIEVNQGGDMVRHTLNSVRPGLPIREVRATRAKHVRAEPIASLYALGRVSHVGTFERLEDQMCQMTASGFEGNGSPDRVDALVWAFTQLFPALTKRPKKEERIVRRTTYVGNDGWMAA